MGSIEPTKDDIKFLLNIADQVQKITDSTCKVDKLFMWKTKKGEVFFERKSNPVVHALKRTFFRKKYASSDVAANSQRLQETLDKFQRKSLYDIRQALDGLHRNDGKEIDEKKINEDMEKIVFLIRDLKTFTGEIISKKSAIIGSESHEAQKTPVKGSSKKTEKEIQNLKTLCTALSNLEGKTLTDIQDVLTAIGKQQEELNKQIDQLTNFPKLQEQLVFVKNDSLNIKELEKAVEEGNQDPELLQGILESKKAELQVLESSVELGSLALQVGGSPEKAQKYKEVHNEIEQRGRLVGEVKVLLEQPSVEKKSITDEKKSITEKITNLKNLISQTNQKVGDLKNEGLLEIQKQHDLLQQKITTLPEPLAEQSSQLLSEAEPLLKQLDNSSQMTLSEIETTNAKVKDINEKISAVIATHTQKKQDRLTAIQGRFIKLIATFPQQKEYAGIKQKLIEQSNKVSQLSVNQISAEQLQSLEGKITSIEQEVNTIIERHAELKKPVIELPKPAKEKEKPAKSKIFKQFFTRQKGSPTPVEKIASSPKELVNSEQVDTEQEVQAISKLLKELEETLLQEEVSNPLPSVSSEDIKGEAPKEKETTVSKVESNQAIERSSVSEKSLEEAREKHVAKIVQQLSMDVVLRLSDPKLLEIIFCKEFLEKINNNKSALYEVAWRVPALSEEDFKKEIDSILNQINSGIQTFIDDVKSFGEEVKKSMGSIIIDGNDKAPQLIQVQIDLLNEAKDVKVGSEKFSEKFKAVENAFSKLRAKQNAVNMLKKKNGVWKKWKPTTGLPIVIQLAVLASPADKISSTIKEELHIKDYVNGLVKRSGINMAKENEQYVDKDKNVIEDQIVLLLSEIVKSGTLDDAKEVIENFIKYLSDNSLILNDEKKDMLAWVEPIVYQLSKKGISSIAAIFDIFETLKPLSPGLRSLLSK